MGNCENQWLVCDDTLTLNTFVFIEAFYCDNNDKYLQCQHFVYFSFGWLCISRLSKKIEMSTKLRWKIKNNLKNPEVWLKI